MGVAEVGSVKIRREDDCFRAKTMGGNFGWLGW